MNNKVRLNQGDVRVLYYQAPVKVWDKKHDCYVNLLKHAFPPTERVTSGSALLTVLALGNDFYLRLGKETQLEFLSYKPDIDKPVLKLSLISGRLWIENMQNGDCEVEILGGKITSSSPVTEIWIKPDKIEVAPRGGDAALAYGGPGNNETELLKGGELNTIIRKGSAFSTGRKDIVPDDGWRRFNIVSTSSEIASGDINPNNDELSRPALSEEAPEPSYKETAARMPVTYSEPGYGQEIPGPGSNSPGGSNTGQENYTADASNNTGYQSGASGVAPIPDYIPTAKGNPGPAAPNYRPAPVPGDAAINRKAGTEQNPVETGDEAKTESEWGNIVAHKIPGGLTTSGIDKMPDNPEINWANGETELMDTEEHAEKLMEEVKDMFDEYYGMKLEKPIQLVFVKRDDYKTMNGPLGMASVSGKLYVLQGLEVAEAFGVMAHEMGHMWVFQHSPKRNNIYAQESFATWISYKLCIKKGYYHYAVSISGWLYPGYQKAFTMFHELEREKGEQGIFEYMISKKYTIKYDQ
ncbi:MAG: hypothetical protein M1269_07100 [Chloroflexi bacterium]|nr:hypothetical protein [Chloroflexota bacterium]